ncbi:MAG: universal stress protein [Bacteroidetes bacterium]|nr:universal stress protein [Bacteroidota bacterium]
MDANTTLRNILLPTDFSELSRNALTSGIAMCKRHNATLHLLHVVDNRYLVVPHEAHNTTIYLMPESEKSGMTGLEKLADTIKSKNNIKVETHLDNGSPVDIIGKKAIDLHCELIVMGTHGASGMRKFFMGSTAYSVIKHTVIPVLTVPGSRKVKDFKRILFPIRASKKIIEKYGFIIPIIERNNAELIIAGLSLPDEPYSSELLNEEITELGSLLKLNGTNFKSEHFICKNYAKKVLELAKKEKADLIVINASLDYTWQQFFIGPYTQQVVNHATVPVLSIRSFPDLEALAKSE